MVADAPRIDSVLPAFLEFARDAVLVAHNAPFDIGFLKAAAARTGHDWPRFQVVDTVHLARQLVTRDEAPNRKLSTLAQLFGAATTPDHRALHDARATVDVLHGLLERVGNLGVDTLEELHDVLLPGQPRPAPQAPPRRGAAVSARGLPLQGPSGPGALRRHVARHPAAGPHLLHRLRAAHPDGRDGGHRRERHAGRVRTPPSRPRSASCG